ncbi:MULTISPECIES: DUF6138 family protein [Flavobacterium]|uniref:DUF6138 family protein n=1 Tax=Flavobacterium TaxID=237 RepID=UPI0011832F7A|nr:MULTISPECIES: DUF6138 family protein [Flavobacterium]MCR4031964.1 DUF6138 family protein [Flavobacterium panacis]
MRELNYLVKIEGNEALLEKFIEAINNDTIKIGEDYPNPYVLDSGERFLGSSVIKYFFQTRQFSKVLYVDFFEKLRKLSSFKEISYTIGEWIKEHVTNKFFDVKKEHWEEIITKKTNSETSISEEEKEILSFVCYVAVCHIKYGASYESVTANRYFDMVTELGSNEVAELKKNGTGELPKEFTEYKDSDLTAKANDVFATIEIKLANDNEESYGKALTFINKVLQTDFPKSFEINFSSEGKELLPIKGLPECGQNYLFAGAVKYPNLHKSILEYIHLAKKEYQWYKNLEDENCAMPSTFAVFALGLQDEKYFETLIDYYQTVDEEHQSVQEKFTPVFLEKFGINEKSIKVYIHAISSMQEHLHDKVFVSYFSNEKSLKLLLESKENFAKYYFTKEDLKEFSDGDTDVQEMVDCYWASVMYTTFGQNKGFAKIRETLSDEERTIFEKLQQKE